MYRRWAPLLGLVLCVASEHEQQPAPATGDAWIERAHGISPNGGWISQMTASFTVPRRPAGDDQVLYLFSALEPENGSVIIQPVLQYYRGHWALASWRVAGSTATMRSNLVPTEAGHRIRGTMESTACHSGGVCTWTITAKDMDTGLSSTITEEDSVTYTRYFGAVLEAYYITSCDQLPADAPITFEGISVLDDHEHELHTALSPWVSKRASPSCDYHVSTHTSDEAALYFSATR